MSDDVFDPDTDTAKTRKWLWAYELRDMAEPEWLVEGHLQRDSLSMLAGPSGVGKSFLALDMALSVHYGLPHLGRWQTTRGEIVYIAAEGKRGMWRRIDAWLAHRGVSDDPKFAVIDHGVDLADDSSVSEIRQCVDEAWHGAPPSLIVVDTLHRCNTANENDATEMGDVIRTLDIIRRDMDGATILLIHHTGWAQERERGSSAIRGAVDTLVQIDKAGRVKVEKQKDSEEIDPYTVELLPVRRGAVLQLTGDATEDPREFIRRTFGLAEFSFTEFMSATGLTRGTAHRRLNQWVTDGVLKRNENKYRIA